MNNVMKKFFRSSTIMSLVLIVLGIMLIFQAEATIISISYITGGTLIAIGVLAILKFIKNANTPKKDELNIVYGIGTIILGMLIITYPSAIASFIPFVIGMLIIINSGKKLLYAFELKSNDNSIWKRTMILSIISTICGVVLLFNPFAGAVIITKIIGILILIYATLDIISTISIKKNVSRIHNAIEETIMDAVIVEETDTTEKKKTKKKKKKSD